MLARTKFSGAGMKNAGSHNIPASYWMVSGCIPLLLFPIVSHSGSLLCVSFRLHTALDRCLEFPHAPLASGFHLLQDMGAGALLLYRLALQGWGTLSSTPGVAGELHEEGQDQQSTSLEPVTSWVPVHVPEFNSHLAFRYCSGVLGLSPCLFLLFLRLFRHH